MMRRTGILVTCLACAMTVLGVGFMGCGGTTDQAEDVKYTVTYVRGNDGATGDIPEPVGYKAGETFSLLSADTFSFEGHEFIYWYDGTDNYSASAVYTMPAHDVQFTAVWHETGSDDPNDTDNPDDPNKPDDGKPDEPTLAELDAEFYDASNWEYMTNNSGASLDGGDIAYSLADGSIKFHRANQAVELADLSNGKASFMLKATNDFCIWFNSSSKDNADNYSYRLAYAYGGLRLVVSSAPDQAAALVDTANYKKGEWNRIDIEFSTVDKLTQIKLYINGKRAELSAGDNTSQSISVENNVLSHTRPSMFKTGNYMVVKVWEAHNYVQLKPVAKAEEKDVPIIACIGASITEGAGAGNFYTESYPAQLQNALGGGYNVINFGKSGRTVRTDLGVEGDGTPIAWLENNQFEGVKTIKPDYAIFNIGTNDSKSTNDPLSTHDTFKAAYEHLLDEVLKANPDMGIFICTVPYAYSSIYDISNDNIRDIIAPVQREIAEERGYTLIDLYNIVQNKSLLFGDGVHPNTTGYAMFVEIIEKAFKEGAAGLTQEFLDYIDEKYNDPEYELSNVRAALEVVGDKINLTVTGNIDMEDTSAMRLAVETGTDGDEREMAIIPEADGSFGVTIDLATLTSAKWYNVRIYLTETFYYFVRLAETDYESGDTFNTSTKLVTVRTWTSGGENTFSFTVGNYNQLELTTATIIENDGKIDLRLVGTTGESRLTLYVCDDKEHNNLIDITVNDGEFDVTFDLATLISEGSGWYNVRILFSDGTYYTVRYTEVKNASGATLAVDDAFLGTDKKVTVKTWGNDNPLSLQVSAYDSSYSVTATEVKMENGKLVFGGTTVGVTSLEAYLSNGETDKYGGDVTLASDGSFTYEIDLAQLSAAQGNWYYLRISANGNESEKVVYTAYDSTEYYFYGTRHYVWQYWEGIAISYTNYLYNLADASITDLNGVATLTVSGSLADSTVAAEDIVLWLDDNTGNPVKLTNTSTVTGAFAFTYDISQLDDGKPYYIRLYNGTTKIADVNSRWVAEKIFYEKEIGTDNSYQFYKNTTDNTYNTLGVLRTDKSVPDPVITATNVRFENGYLVFVGSTENVDTLAVYLTETNQTITQNATLESDGSFTVRFDLSELTSGNGCWYRLQISANDKVAENVPYYNGFDTTLQYAYGSRTYKFTTEYNTTTFTMLYSATGFAYQLTELTVTEIDGKAMLTLAGLMNDTSTAADSLTLILNKTSAAAETLTFMNTATENGTFRFVIDVSELTLSINATTQAEAHYFIRLYKDEKKFADVNSRWSDSLFEPIEIGDSIYYFTRNSTGSTYNTLGIIRVAKTIE